jgi:hypothetical protein
MTFGLLKSIIEENLLQSYKDEKAFKKAINEFKHNVLNNKNISKVYSIYDELTKPQGLSKEEATDFLNEGIFLLRTLLPNIKLPSNLSEMKVENKYKNLDSLLYPEISKTNIKERVETKKTLLEVISSQPNISKPKVNIPLSSMVKIANDTLKNYIENLDENSKKEFFDIIKEDTKTLESNFESFKKIAIEKLTPLMEQESDSDTKNRISETLEKIQKDNFNQISYLKLKKLVESL